jgi:spore maturation protein CgeB
MRPKPGLSIAFFGSSLISAYWNGAATYYRGIIRALHSRGHRVTFFEPDAYHRQRHRDIPDPPWAKVVVYSAETSDALLDALEESRQADLVIKASGVGVFDELIESALIELQTATRHIAFWDVDVPATLDRVQSNPEDPFRQCIPQYDFILTHGGGQRVIDAYESLGARQCIPIYNALDPDTHFPVKPVPRFESDLGFLGNRLPDRERRVEGFFLDAARRLSNRNFLLGGAGWQDKDRPRNVRYVGHVSTQDHNAFNCSSVAVLNINRESMARYGFSPPTRVFEAAGAGACLISDAWNGIDQFLEPGTEILLARNGAEVAEYVDGLTREQATRIGVAARRRVLDQHTYSHRAEEFEAVLDGRDVMREVMR